MRDTKSKQSNKGPNRRLAQFEKFREAARELETDQSESAFDKVVKRIAKAPKPKGGKKDN